MPLTFINNSDFMNWDAFKDKLLVTHGVAFDMIENGFEELGEWRKFLENDCDTKWEDYLLKKMIEDGYVETHHIPDVDIMFYRLKKNVGNNK